MKKLTKDKLFRLDHKTRARNRRNELYEDRRACSTKNLNLGVLNVQGCSTSEEKREEIGDMFRRRKLGILALC